MMVNPSALFHLQLHEVQALSAACSGCLTGVVYVDMSQVRATKKSYILHSEKNDTLGLQFSEGHRSLSRRIKNYTEPPTTQGVPSLHRF